MFPTAPAASSAAVSWRTSWLMETTRPDHLAARRVAAPRVVMTGHFTDPQPEAKVRDVVGFAKATGGQRNIIHARLVGSPPRRQDRAEKPQEWQEDANNKYYPMTLPERQNAKSDDEYKVEDTSTNDPHHFDLLLLKFHRFRRCRVPVALKPELLVSPGRLVSPRLRGPACGWP